MPLGIGTRIGSHEIVAAIGAGGMGEVYRARDTKLNRDVALKILPETFAADPDRLARFRREAQTLASLNHPNIAAIYGFEDSGAVHALVMELVSGPTLADRIAAGPIPLADALPIARQIADALEAAHEQGIVHRDMKPANVKVRDDGTVKVLDFGLAKALEGDGSGVRQQDSAPSTMTSPAMTQMGMILGTAAYMAPEQAKGRPVDKRADIWAFGVVLHEMLTGRRLFDAEDVSETLAAVLTRDVGIATLPAALPARLRALIRDCLVRDAKQRLRDIGDARIVLEKMIAGASEEITPAAALPLRWRWRRLAWPGIALVLFAAASVLAARLYLQPTAIADPVRFTVSPPDGVSVFGQRLSPDGRMLAYIGAQEAKALVWVHAFETATARPLPGTDGIGASVFAWSPDSKWLIFSSEGKLRKISVEGGPSQLIGALPARSTFTGDWGAGDVVLLGSTSFGGGPLLRVPATAGEPTPATELDAAKREIGHRHPHFLPDGRHFFFLASSSRESHAAYVGSLDSKERVPLPGIGSAVWYAPSGHVLFLRDGALMSQPFDLGRLELAGSATTVVEGIAEPTATEGLHSVSRSGTLAYRSTSGARTSQLIWFDRTGKRLEPAGPAAAYGDIELSLDERYVAFESGLSSADIWVLDLRNGVLQRVTSDPGRDADPVWSPDGKTIAFRSDRGGGRLYSRAFGVVGEDKPMRESADRESPASWSRDGKYLAFQTGADTFALPLAGDLKPIRVTQSAPGTLTAESQISPDGRWIAYHSTELGQLDVFIQSFPQPGAKQRVSPKGGHTARWSHDGRELFYVSPTNMLMATGVTTLGGSLSVGAPVSLFEMKIPGGTEGEYAVSATGRFLLNVPNAQTAERPISVILNWSGGAKR